MKLLLISGHGAGDPGATATIGGVTYTEAEETIKAAEGVKNALAAYDCEVSVYDESRNAYADYKLGTLNARAQFINYDYVLELHFNACVNDLTGNGKTTGVEVYWPSICAASGAEDSLLDAVSAFGLTRRKAAAGQFAVINTAARAGCKANLLEVCFLDDADDMAIYTAKRGEICAAIAGAVATAFGIERKVEEMTEEQVRSICKEVVTELLRGDGTQVSATLKPEFEAAVAAGITDGSRPGGYATRAQTAVMVERALKQG